jgi:predicted TPR repeat methyltransferase
MEAPLSPHDMSGALYDEASIALGNHAHEVLFGLMYAHVRPGELLLDIGIGTGLASQLFHRAGLCIVGVDSAEEMLAHCRAKGIAERLVVHDLASTPWPFEGARFDHAIACGLFHFFVSLDPLLAELARVVRTGGVVGFTTMERAAPIPSPISVFAHTRPHVLERCRAHGLEVSDDVAFETPARSSRDAHVGFRAYVSRASGRT